MKDNNKYYFGYYVVAFVDLLGQRDEMKKFRGLPKNASGPDYDEFIQTVKTTIGRIYDIQKTCQEFFEAFSNRPYRVNIPQEYKQMFENLGKTHIRYQHFSDGLVIFVPLKEDEVTSPLKSVYGLLSACAGMMLFGFAKKSPIRGGLTVGLGTELNESEIYGPVVGEAYELEKEIAQYPRFVIGNEFLAYIDHFTQKALQLDDIRGMHDVAVADTCKRLLTYDFDGYAIVDYMGNCFHEMMKTNEAYEYIIKEAREFIHSSLAEFQRRQDSLLAFRYKLLHSYFEGNIDKWLLPAQQDNPGYPASPGR
jgi:hypothetical protein